MDLLNITPNFWLQNEVECLEWLTNELHWNSVPLLNANYVQDLHDKQLVKFRGMVQDMFNPEYFYEKYEVVDECSMDRSIRNGKYTDVTQCKDTEILDHTSTNNITSERQTLVMISIPGLNEWVENIEKAKYKIQSHLSNSHEESPSKLKKRTLEAADEHIEMELLNPSTVLTNIENNKKQCINENSKPSSNAIVSQEHILNFPFPERTGKACHVKVYKDAEKMKLNDMIEVVGFLSVDPILADIDDDDCDSKMEIQTHNPPPSLIPRVHCVKWKKMEHNNPLVENNLEVEKIQNLKKELHIVLTQLFMGDSLAAEYFIYHLISKIYLRNELLPLGKFTLNISNIPVSEVPEYGKQLYEFIELLVPKSHYLPMTLENMNELAFTPKKDYECDRVTSGLLQLSNNTHLVLDETKLTTGRLNESGVKGVAALSTTIKTQKTTYDFNYYPMEFDCDIPFLILSEGKSLLPSDVHVLLKPDTICVTTFNEIVEAAKHFLKQDLLNELRIYLTLARHGKYELADNVQELIQNEFVKMRQEKAVTPDDLHQLLVLSRLVCLSEGKASLDDTCWKNACSLEAERKKRLP